ncbi:hypothetical protein RMSM_03923 [Rhodopirellula maiorica SM1]|uniref:Uncharacterized protein n=1 Tax=Rhodopirellula maiorica SM1 TaxID=1265738 RepID=M5RIX1_9BACT|nr:hypothetical protein RMSM_03923 [Rhodopirellula maiorica SM1]
MKNGASEFCLASNKIIEGTRNLQRVAVVNPHCANHFQGLAMRESNWL